MKPLTLVTLRCPQRCFLGVVVATDEGPRVIMSTRNEKHSISVSDFPTGFSERRRTKGTRIFAIRLDELPGLDFGCRHGGGIAAVADLRALVVEVRAGTTRAGVDHILRAGQVPKRSDARSHG